jgi:hypothetical protein
LPSIQLYKLYISTATESLKKEWACSAHAEGRVPEENMSTLKKTELFHLEIAGKVRTCQGCCLDRSFVCIKTIIHEIPLVIKM